ncbi:MAG: hypothetical protein WBO70_04855 [Erysipelotrichaceae bacterium]
MKYRKILITLIIVLIIILPVFSFWVSSGTKDDDLAKFLKYNQQGIKITNYSNYWDFSVEKDSDIEYIIIPKSEVEPSYYVPMAYFLSNYQNNVKIIPLFLNRFTNTTSYYQKFINKNKKYKLILFENNNVVIINLINNNNDINQVYYCNVQNDKINKQYQLVKGKDELSIVQSITKESSTLSEKYQTIGVCLKDFSKYSTSYLLNSALEKTYRNNSEKLVSINIYNNYNQIDRIKYYLALNVDYLVVDLVNDDDYQKFKPFIKDTKIIYLNTNNDQPLHVNYDRSVEVNNIIKDSSKKILYVGNDKYDAVDNRSYKDFYQAKDDLTKIINNYDVIICENDYLIKAALSTKTKKQIIGFSFDKKLYQKNSNLTIYELNYQNIINEITNIINNKKIKVQLNYTK